MYAAQHWIHAWLALLMQKKNTQTGETFQPYLEQIDQIDTSVNELEQTVLLMDEYTKQLEGKFRKLKEREREREREEARKGKRLSK